MIQDRARGATYPRSWILAGIVIGALTAASSAVQAAESSASEAQHQYDVPAGTLDRALKIFASQAGVMLSVDASLTTGKSSAGLAGSYSVTRGFELLLAGSGLYATEMDPGNYSVSSLPASNSSSATTLRKIKVEEDLDAVGTVEQGYRSDAVSAVGPWQGRTLQDTPYSVAVVTRDLIENLQATTPDQILRINPTTQLLYPQRDNDGPLYQQRGFVLSAPYQDGLPGDQIAHATTTEDVEQIEILSGLSGFLYGMGNVGGTTNYISKRPTADRLNRLTLGNNGGSNYYLHGDFGGPIDRDGRFGYRINVIGQDGETVVDQEDSKKTFFSTAFDWHVTDRLLLQALASKRDFEVSAGRVSWAFASGVPRISAEEIDPSVSWGQPWATKHWKNTKYGARLRWDASDLLVVRAAWNRNENERTINTITNTIQSNGTYTQRIRNYYPPGTDSMLSEHEDNTGYLFGDLSLRTGDIAHTLTVGAQRRESTQARFANTAPQLTLGTGLSLDAPVYISRPVVAPTDRGALIRPTIVGITTDNFIVGDDIAFNDRWSLLAGVAHSKIDDKLSGDKSSATTPTASIIFKPIPSLTTYATYMEALEQGGVAADDFNGEAVVNAGEVMDPLISDQLEIGAKWSLGGLLVSAALFEIDKSLQYYDLSTPTAPVFVQDGRQIHRGIEFTVLGKATEHFTLICGVTQLDAKVKEHKETPALEGKRTPSAAETLIKLRAEYQVPMLPELTLIGGAAYIGDSYFDAMNTDRLPSYTLLDVGARFSTTVAGYPATLRLDLNNAGNERYWTYGSVLGDPRTLLLSISADF